MVGVETPKIKCHRSGDRYNVGINNNVSTRPVVFRLTATNIVTREYNKILSLELFSFISCSSRHLAFYLFYIIQLHDDGYNIFIIIVIDRYNILHWARR